MANAGGVGIWELSGDATGANSLLSAIHTVVQAGGVVPTNAPVGSTVTFKGNNGLYVTSNNADSPMACNRPVAQAWEEFTVVSAGYGKVALQAMGHYVSSEDGQNSMTCNRPIAQGWETFGINQ